MRGGDIRVAHECPLIRVEFFGRLVPSKSDSCGAKMRSRRESCGPLLLVFLLALSADAYGTPTDGSLMSAVKTLIFGNEMSPPAVNTSAQGQPMRHYALPSLPQQTPQVYAVQPAYPQYYVGPQPQDVCNLPQQVGTGPYRIPRWTFNSARKRCELFYWSGCCANGNNFANYHACQQQCEVSSCDLDKDEGIGSMSLLRYYFDRHSRMCAEFRYRGSGGNKNHFVSLPECRKICPESPSPCAYATEQPVQCSPGSVLTSTCTGQQYCHVGATPETTVCCNRPTDIDPCHQPANVGVGNANLQRWYFNSHAQCENQCQVNPCRVGAPYRTPAGIAFCSPTDQSMCPAGFYCHIGATAQTSVCCQALVANPCNEPKEEGDGRQYMIRYYYDKQKNQCLPFNYKGTRGGQNNFLSKVVCERRCAVWTNPCARGQPILDANHKPMICSLENPCRMNYFCHQGADEDPSVCCPGGGNPCTAPMTQGTGNHALQRWFFNSLTRQCERFVYKGYHGNSNSFCVREQCEATCASSPNPCPVGEPLVAAGETLPLVCDPTKEDSCPSSHFCHWGVDNQTRLCCPGRIDPCILARAEGEGAKTTRRWYFDVINKQCQPLNFRGMKGNANNFPDKATCEARCPVVLDPT
ncbi:hypothetical protein M3Y99_01775600 [Aphelenchoides fujianensis]|nr:hypothetical protein M3Y99_01775600 [Aphelenchoides fujianensis]